MQAYIAALSSSPRVVSNGHSSLARSYTDCANHIVCIFMQRQNFITTIRWLTLNRHSTMKLKFVLLTFLLVFARGCDFYSTSLWFFDNPTGETNPLYKYFGIGWTGLIITNIIIVGLVIYAFFYFYFRYKRPTNFSKEPTNYRELASLQY